MEYITTLPKQIKGVDIAEVHSLAMSPAMQLHAGVSTVRRSMCSRLLEAVRPAAKLFLTWLRCCAERFCQCRVCDVGALPLLQGCLANSPHDCIGSYVVRYVLEDTDGKLRPTKVVRIHVHQA